jgi:flagellar hook assembly protein FlgD
MNNTHNPNNPPQLVTAGLNTSDEMFLVYFHYMLYQNGDENYDMEALMSASLTEQLIEDGSSINVYPNPFSAATTITCESINSGDIVSVFVYDYQGKLIRKLIQSEVVSSNDFETTWDGMNEQNSEVLAGVYFLSITVNGQNFTKQLIKN